MSELVFFKGVNAFPPRAAVLSGTPDQINHLLRSFRRGEVKTLWVPHTLITGWRLLCNEVPIRFKFVGEAWTYEEIQQALGRVFRIGNVGSLPGVQTKKMSPWQAETDPLFLRRYGKSVEELGELVSVIGRCICQGIDEVDPSTGKYNHARLEEETADVFAQLKANIGELELDRQLIDVRTDDKTRQMAEWESVLKQTSGNIPTVPQPEDDNIA